MTFMLFDVDRFNSINDTFGHHIGDQTIIEIVRRIEVALPNKAVLIESVS
ncbi:diguanylate cyclase domain-containing protein [Shewanella marinintestina]